MNKMQPGMRVGGEIKGAEGVALAGHVLPQQVPGAMHLQVGLQVRLLLEKKTLDFEEVLILVSTFMVAISRSCSCFSWSMWKLACTCWISSTSFTCKSRLVLRRKVNKIGELVFTAGQTTQLDNLMLVQRAACVCCRSTERERDESSSYEIIQNKAAPCFPASRPKYIHPFLHNQPSHGICRFTRRDESSGYESRIKLVTASLLAPKVHLLAGFLILGH